jgi:hypothetical protein
MNEEHTDLPREKHSDVGTDDTVNSYQSIENKRLSSDDNSNLLPSYPYSLNDEKHRKQLDSFRRQESLLKNEKRTPEDILKKQINILAEVEQHRRKILTLAGFRNTVYRALRGFSIREQVTTPVATDRVSFMTNLTRPSFYGGPPVIICPDIMMGYLNMQEPNKIIWTKTFVVLDSGRCNIFARKLSLPLRPPYGEELIKSIVMSDYSIFMSDQRRIYLTPMESAAADVKSEMTEEEIGFQSLDSANTSITLEEWADAFNAHSRYAQSCLERKT